MISWETDLLCLFFTQVLVHCMINVYKNDLPQEWLLILSALIIMCLLSIKVLHTMHFRFTKLKLATVFLSSCHKKIAKLRAFS